MLQVFPENLLMMSWIWVKLIFSSCHLQTEMIQHYSDLVFNTKMWSQIYSWWWCSYFHQPPEGSKVRKIRGEIKWHNKRHKWKLISLDTNTFDEKKWKINSEKTNIHDAKWALFGLFGKINIWRGYRKVFFLLQNHFDYVKTRRSCYSC